MPFDPVSYALAKKAFRQAVENLLSELVIDVDKDWKGRSITNIGTLIASLVDVGDLLLRHGWRLFEREDGLYLTRDGQEFRIKMEEVN